MVTRYAKKKDANQNPIVEALEAIGCSVYDASRVGGDFPDLIVAKGLKTMLIEVKNPERSKGRRELSKGQNKFLSGWRGYWARVLTVDEAVAEATRYFATGESHAR